MTYKNGAYEVVSGAILKREMESDDVEKHSCKQECEVFVRESLGAVEVQAGGV